jgi:hypothetical protein
MVFVEPNLYPVFNDGFATFWLLVGHINRRSLRLGDGLAEIRGSDEPSDIPVTFTSKRFGPQEFADFLKEGVCTEGSPEYRLKFRLDVIPST